MQLTNNRLYDAVAEQAQGVKIEFICLGLGYTAVTTSDGRVGLAYTYFDHKTGCSLVRDYQDFEGQPAGELLSLIRSSIPLERSMALALVNALAAPAIAHLPTDRYNALLWDTLGVGASSKVAMVGLFKPLVAALESAGATVEVIDNFRALGEKSLFYEKLDHWADAALITSTSLLNSTFEDIMEHVGDGVKVALLGPSTPMVAEAFSNWPRLKALAGMVPLDREGLMKSVRHGLGTPHLQKSSKKVTLVLQTQQ